MNNIIHIISRLDSPQDNLELGALIISRHLHLLQEFLYTATLSKRDEHLLFLADTAKMALVLVSRKTVSGNS